MSTASLAQRPILAALFAAAMAAAGPAEAYMGPGAGLGMIGSLIAVIGAVLLAALGLVLFPLRLLLKRRRKATEQASSEPPVV